MVVRYYKTERNDPGYLKDKVEIQDSAISCLVWKAMLRQGMLSPLRIERKKQLPDSCFFHLYL
jgi:hypothetical protein